MSDPQTSSLDTLPINIPSNLQRVSRHFRHFLKSCKDQLHYEQCLLNTFFSLSSLRASPQAYRSTGLRKTSQLLSSTRQHPTSQLAISRSVPQPIHPSTHTHTTIIAPTAMTMATSIAYQNATASTRPPRTYLQSTVNSTAAITASTTTMLTRTKATPFPGLVRAANWKPSTGGDP